MAEVASAVNFIVTGDPVLALAFGVCNDEGELTPLGATPAAFLQTVNGGNPAGFIFVEVYPEGVVMALIIDFFGINTLPPGSYDLLTIEYLLDGPSDTVAEISYCDTLGDPIPIEVEVVIVRATS